MITIRPLIVFEVLQKQPATLFCPHCEGSSASQMREFNVVVLGGESCASPADNL